MNSLKLRSLSESIVKEAHRPGSDIVLVNLLLSAVYALKKAMEFDYTPTAEFRFSSTSSESMARIAGKLAQGEKLLGENWTATFFYNAAERLVREANIRAGLGKKFSQDSIDPGELLSFIEEALKSGKRRPL